MNQNQALTIIVQAVKVAQTKGAFTLEEAKIIAEAVEVFTPKQEEVGQMTSPTTGTTKVEETKKKAK